MRKGTGRVASAGAATGSEDAGNFASINGTARESAFQTLALRFALQACKRMPLRRQIRRRHAFDRMLTRGEQTPPPGYIFRKSLHAQPPCVPRPSLAALVTHFIRQHARSIFNSESFPFEQVLEVFKRNAVRRTALYGFSHRVDQSD